jgi:hypothetical protein
MPTVFASLRWYTVRRPGMPSPRARNSYDMP